jgi:hypothetical protein
LSWDVLRWQWHHTPSRTRARTRADARRRAAPQVTAAACVLESYDATPAVRFLRLRVVRAAAAHRVHAHTRRRVAPSPSFCRN